MRHYEFKDAHGDNLPTVRIQKAVLENFKSVNYGEITFDCGRHFVPYDTKSDILGIYGQNGSGKTSLIEALSILDAAMCGAKIPDIYSECVEKGKKKAHLEFTFDLQYPDGRIRKVVYSFDIAAMKKDQEDKAVIYAEDAHNSIDTGTYVKLFNEKISMSGDFEGEKRVLKPVIDTSSDKELFEPISKHKYFINNKVSIDDLKYTKRMMTEKSKSFIFCDDTLSAFYDADIYSEYFQVLLELNYYAQWYLFVIDTKSTGFIRLSFGLPLYTTLGVIMLKEDGPQIMPKEMYDDVEHEFKGINQVLGMLIPGLNIELKILSPATTKDGKEGVLVELLANRNGLLIPLRDESDGVRKIISILGLIIRVYNDRSVTVAIDELDAGVYEYLLGELLQMIEESGKGQLIFTSHNLRPLEVINKDFLYFTTTNADNRYIRLKGIGKTNNLRTTYFREIIMGEQDEELYKKSKKHKVLNAFQLAGIAMAGMGAVSTGVATASIKKTKTTKKISKEKEVKDDEKK